MPPRSRRGFVVFLLVLLLAIAHVQAASATLGVFWRATVLSWDSPTTQLVEEIASSVVPLTDPGRLASERLDAAARSRARTDLPASPTARRSPTRDCGVTRAPPTA